MLINLIRGLRKGSYWPETHLTGDTLGSIYFQNIILRLIYSRGTQLKYPYTSICHQFIALLSDSRSLLSTVDLFPCFCFFFFGWILSRGWIYRIMHRHLSVHPGSKTKGNADSEPNGRLSNNISIHRCQCEQQKWGCFVWSLPLTMSPMHWHDLLPLGHCHKAQWSAYRM